MRAILKIALGLTFAFSATAAEKNSIELQPLLQERALGYVILAFENRVVRQVRLVFDGLNYRIVMAGQPTMILDPDAARVRVRPHPRGPFHVTIYEWDDARYPHLVQLMVRPQQVLELENDTLYGGAKHELPTLILTLVNRQTELPEIQGGLYLKGQDDRDLNELIESLRPVGGSYVSLRDSDDQLCALDIDRLRIQTRR